MINTLLGIKKNMTSTYDARGRRVGATIVEIVPNFVTAVKTTETKDGYNAVQIGTAEKKSVKKPQIGHFKKAGVDKKLRYVKEVKVESVDVEPGLEIKLNQVFSIGDSVKVTGTSKGKGFQGGVRRHGFAGGPKTHGQSDRHRAPGSIGAGTTPGRVYKGKKMAGHMGSETVTYRNLEVVGLDRALNLLTIKGGIPGAPGSLITVTKLGRIKGYTPPPEEKLDEEEEGAEGNEGEVVSENPAEIVEVAQPENEQAPQDATEKEGNQGEENAS
jgi:large subunit ribosomal protein L3